MADRAHWEEALTSGSYERSTRGATLAEVGFVHAAYPEQLPGVVAAHYVRETGELVVLEIDVARLGEATPVRVEPGDPDDPEGEHYPHLYGPVPVEAVVRTRPARVERGWLDLGGWEPGPGA
ncbi:DUF952 domain-containing protein [uncultured Ornithinimicrobium sp.]|uniref:DUF952 domain-containing protein n=1 Tax=uncultured Ornithinimicrobium sp. TaxID=259307 RepID=UPI002598BAA9|nr:DUF952 domain-containing protein [uncultured Ornithinimicrobium sp.]